MTLLFLGLPLVMARHSRNIFVAAGSCLLMVAIFLIVVLASHGLGMSYLLKPALAAWGPLLVFVPGAVAMSEPLRR
jgi:lipopolysaccharide export system permease protein